MTFTNDIFISYRHIDNRPISGSIGWIDDFEEKLKAQLAFKLGYDPVIWRDPELRGSEFFDEVIMKELAQSKVLVSILSPGYIDPSSDWCLRELAEFCRLAQTNIGLRIGEKSRCIKVVKTVLSRDKHPVALKGPLGYEFFDEDPQLRRLRDFSYLPGSYQHNRYLDKIDQISFDIAELLTEINNPKNEAATGPTVYLAETTSDRAEYRDSIQNELRSRGYRVLPDEELPETAAEYREAVTKNLGQAVLSVHLIGNRYGSILEGEEEKSIVDIQNELAVQRCDNAPAFSRVIWIGPDVVPTGKYHPAFVESLKTDPQAQKGAEVIERSFEELKNRIIERVTTPKPTARLLQFPRFEELVRIYVMCDKSDFSAVKELRDYLFEKKYEVILSAREGDDGQAIQFHKDNLLDCDAALIYYGQGNEFWQHSKLSDLRKAAGWGREKQLLCKAIYLASPETDHKREYRLWEAVILKPPGYEGLAAEALEEFISYIETARAEQVRTGGGAR
jgi:hypothetical protein